MIKRWFCMFIAVITVNFSFFGCVSFGEIHMMSYKSSNMELIEKSIKEKNAKLPVVMRNKEVILHINQGPVAAILFERESMSWKGIDLGNGSEDQQIDLIKTTDLWKKGPKMGIISRDYSKSLSCVMEKQLGRYFSKVKVIDNDPKAVGKGINVTSLFNFDEVSGSTNKATVTITASLPVGPPITATGTYEYHHLNTYPLAIIAIILTPGVIGLIPMLIVTSIQNRANASSVWLAMNIACENLASQLAPRIAALKGNIINIEMAVTEVQVRESSIH
jgi:hypothetical protein